MGNLPMDKSVASINAFEHTNANASGRQWKRRYSPNGVHFFDRITGLNVLLDEITVPTALWSRAPRQVSIAITNECDLACAHCYAPKTHDSLQFNDVARWLLELDGSGALGVGLGGGEPTLHPDFAALCQYATRKTRLAVSFTTHAHHIDDALADQLRGNINFVRVSMDGVGATYEAIRHRSFSRLLKQVELVRTMCQFGVNIVVNELTLPDLAAAATIAEELGANDLLLLPQVPSRSHPAVNADTLQALQSWVNEYRGGLRLCINAGCAEGFPTCEPLPGDDGLRAYAHIDATGRLKPTSYHATGVPVGKTGVLTALDRLSHELAKANL